MESMTIAQDKATSTPVRVAKGRLMSLATEDAWDAADLVLLSADERDGTYLPVCKDEAGNPAYLIPFAQNKRVALDANAMALAACAEWVKVQSVAAGDATTPVNQGQAVTINVDLK